MNWRHQPSVDAVGKHVARPQFGHGVVEATDVGNPAAEHDDVRVEQVDHTGERTRQSFFITHQGGIAGAVTRLRQLRDFVCRQVFAAVAHMVGRQRSARQPGFDAAFFATVAG